MFLVLILLLAAGVFVVLAANQEQGKKSATQTNKEQWIESASQFNPDQQGNDVFAEDMWRNKPKASFSLSLDWNE